MSCKKTVSICFIAVMNVFTILAQGITEIIGPPGSGAFATNITTLPNGNFVVTDPLYDSGGLVDVGAVHLYDGATRTLISTLRGSHTNDKVGDAGVFVLPNSNYVVISASWDGTSDIDVGAATWCSGSTGISGIVSESNSLFGVKQNDLGYANVIILDNGNYFVHSSQFDNGSAVNAGSITWGNGTTGVSGAISTANSLVGGYTNDIIGKDYGYERTLLTKLPNGNCVLRSPFWHNGSNQNAGAVTWLSASGPTIGIVSSLNSIVGTNSSDDIGSYGVTVLNNGNYVIASMNWDNGAIANAGAVTWCNGLGGTKGYVSASNSLVGTQAGETVGQNKVVPLTNGNYVVADIKWNSATATRVGAVIWANGSTGLSGSVSNTNALIGSKTDDFVGWAVVALSNGNYVVGSNRWDNGSIVDAGAVTWCDGTTGRVGVVDASNSLLGTGAGMKVGEHVTPLKNGHYVVNSAISIPSTPKYDCYSTWCDGTTVRTGIVDISNSLYGTVTSTSVGVCALSNGNYVVIYPYAFKSGVSGCGSATLCDGSTGLIGPISTSNSLMGNYDDRVGSYGVLELSNGNYLVRSNYWSNGAGAVTWCSGASGRTGVVSATNSIVGSQSLDLVGELVNALPNGNYVILSGSWNNGVLSNAGAVTLGNGITGSVGVISSANSLVGSSSGQNLGDRYGRTSFYLLNNSNFLINSVISTAGVNEQTLTWIDGNLGKTGVITENNSFIGSVSGYPLQIAVYPDGNYSIFDQTWDNGAYLDAGAVVYADGQTGVTGRINECNAVLGKVTNSLNGQIAHNTIFDYILVGSSVNNFIRIKTLDKMPVISSVSSASTCGETEADISVNNSHGTIKWYTSLIGGSAVYTGNPYHVTNLTMNKTYYVEATDGSCVLQPRVAVGVSPMAVVASVTDGAQCGAGNVDLRALPSTGSIEWYDAPTGGNLLGSGNTYTTPLISTTTSYWVEANGGPCRTAIRKEVKAYILTNCLTELESTSCGKVLTSMDEAIYSKIITGATNYRYLVQHSATGYYKISVRNNNDNLFRMSWLTEVPVKYGTTYNVSVSAYVNGAWMPYGAVCQISTPPTQLTQTYCGANLNSVTDNISCYPVALATSYRFRVRNVTIGFDQILEPAAGSNTGSLNVLSGIETGRTYDVTVSALVGGTWRAYGKACTLFIPFSTKLEASSCNLSLPTISTELYCVPHVNATDYRYEISLNGKVQSVCVRGSSSNLFRLSWMGTKPAEYNKTYSIRVAAFIGGEWTAYGTPCTVTTPAAIPTQGTEKLMNKETGQVLGMEDPELVIFPNPNNGNFVIRSNVQGIFSLCNELRQELFAYELQNSVEKEVNLTNLSSGVYFLKGNLGDQLIIRKVIVE